MGQPKPKLEHHRKEQPKKRLGLDARAYERLTGLRQAVDVVLGERENAELEEED